MEPKDLKNSEELKSTKKTDLENSEKNALPSEEETNKTTPAGDEKVIPETPLNSEEKTKEEKTASEEQTSGETENEKVIEEESEPEKEGKKEPVAKKAEKEVVEIPEAAPVLVGQEVVETCHDRLVLDLP